MHRLVPCDYSAQVTDHGVTPPKIQLPTPKNKTLTTTTAHHTPTSSGSHPSHHILHAIMATQRPTNAITTPSPPTSAWIKTLTLNEGTPLQDLDFEATFLFGSPISEHDPASIIIRKLIFRTAIFLTIVAVVVVFVVMCILFIEILVFRLTELVFWCFLV